MANEYAVRVHDLHDDTRQRLTHLLQGVAGSYVFVRETDAARPHFQGWIRTDIKPAAFRTRVKKAFPECVGNGFYSVKTVRDHDAYARYILKGTKEEMATVVASCGIYITDEFLASEHRAYWSSHDKPSRSNRAIVDEVDEWVRAQKWPDVYSKVKDVAEKICDTITSRKKALNVHYAKSVLNTVMYRNSEEARSALTRELISFYRVNGDSW